MRPSLHYLLVVSYEVVMRAIFSLPRYRLFNWMKRAFLHARGAEIGRRVVFYPGVWISPGSHLVIGDDVDLALDVLITTGGGVYIGDRTLIGYRTQILSANHRIPDNGGKIFGSGHELAPVSIGSDCWVGAGCMVLPGTTIGEGTVVGAGSVVANDLPPYSIAVGSPARVIRTRGGDRLKRREVSHADKQSGPD